MIGFAVLPILLLFLSRIKGSKFFVVFIFLLLLLIGGLRDSSVGTDTINYQIAFNSIADGVKRNVEPLWEYLNIIVSKVFGSFQWLLIITQIFILFPIYFVSKKLKLNGVLVLFFYVAFYLFAYSLNITRQSVAISISLLTLYYIIQRQHRYAIFWIIVSVFFHYSAIVTLLYFLIPKVPKNLFVQIACITISILIGIVIPGEFLGFLLSYAYEDYLVVADNLGNFSGNLYFLLILNSFYLFIYFIDEEKGGLFKAFFLFIIITNLFIRVPFGMRIITYFSAVQILYLPYISFTNRYIHKEIIFFVLVLYAFSIYIMNFGFGEIFPYSFFFS